MRGEGVGTLRAASEEYTRVIISRESRESHKILLYAFGGIGGIGVICVSKNLGRCTQTSLLSPLIAQKSVSYVLMSNPKTHGSLLITDYSKRSYVKSHRSSLISVPLKILYKTVFLYKSSWKVESAQLENFYFPVGKLFFLSWKFIFFQ